MEPSSALQPRLRGDPITELKIRNLPLFTKQTCRLPPPQPPPNTFPYIPLQMSDFSLFGCIPPDICLIAGMVGNCILRKRAKGHLCSLRGNFSVLDSLLHLIEQE